VSIALEALRLGKMRHNDERMMTVRSREKLHGLREKTDDGRCGADDMMKKKKPGC